MLGWKRMSGPYEWSFIGLHRFTAGIILHVQTDTFVNYDSAEL